MEETSISDTSANNSAATADVSTPIAGEAPAALTKNQAKRAAKAAEIAEKEKHNLQ